VLVWDKGQTTELPDMEQVGGGLMITVFDPDVAHAVEAALAAAVTVTVNEPELPERTETEEFVAGPTKLALPVTDQLKSWASLWSVKSVEEPGQTSSGPTRELVGLIQTAAAFNERSWLPPEPSNEMSRVW
jgi:hypothetical protein